MLVGTQSQLHRTALSQHLHLPLSYLKAGSVPSPTAGCGSGLVIVALGIFESKTHYRIGHVLLIFVSLGLAYFFLQRYNKTQKFMPGGLMAIVAAASACFYGWSYLQTQNLSAPAAETMAGRHAKAL